MSALAGIVQAVQVRQRANLMPALPENGSPNGKEGPAVEREGQVSARSGRGDEIKVRAERRTGELLAVMDQNG